MFKPEEVFKELVPDFFVFFFLTFKSCSLAVTNSGAVCSPTVCEVFTGVGGAGGAGGALGLDMHILFLCPLF
tara:strand:+ start:840 stop:1055 length:216 start_codon:yes stop_codon:yes gene_type:complete